MFHLVYVSKASAPLSSPALRRLLMGSRLRNAPLGVTGLLVYSDGSFLQVLEGPQPAVEDVFGSIARDPRHAGIRVLDRRTVPGSLRNYGDWSMGFADLAGSAQILRGFINLHGLQDLSGLDLRQATAVLAACRRRTAA